MGLENRLEAAEVACICQYNRLHLARILCALASCCQFPCEDDLGVCRNWKASTKRDCEREEKLISYVSIKTEDDRRTRGRGRKLVRHKAAVQIQGGLKEGRAGLRRIKILGSIREITEVFDIVIPCRREALICTSVHFREPRMEDKQISEERTWND